MKQPPSHDAAALSRRLVLGTAVGAASVVTLAACAPQGSTPSTGGSSPTKDLTLPVKLEDIPVGGAVSASLHGAPILISQPKVGEVVAFSAICTHMGCVVLPAKGMFQCPCHGSEYDSTTGAVIQGPATKALPEYRTSLADGEVDVTA